MAIHHTAVSSSPFSFCLGRFSVGFTGAGSLGNGDALDNKHDTVVQMLTV